MREFTVVVKRDNRWLNYPPMPGERACRLLETMQRRKVEAYAMTSANGITETLNLDEMLMAVEGKVSDAN